MKPYSCVNSTLQQHITTGKFLFIYLFIFLDIDWIDSEQT